MASILLIYHNFSLEIFAIPTFEMYFMDNHIAVDNLNVKLFYFMIHFNRLE